MRKPDRFRPDAAAVPADATDALASEIAQLRDLDLAGLLVRSRNPVGGKPPAHTKYWMELLGQAGGPVRPPMLQLTEAERAATRAAFAGCGLRMARQAAE